MRSIAALLVLLFIQNIAAAQAKKYTAELDKLDGMAKAQKALELSQKAKAEGDGESAVELADYAAKQSMTFAQSGTAARAFNQKGKLLLGSGGRKKNKGATGAFRKSLELLDQSGSTDFELMLDNLRNLRTLAEGAGAADEMLKIDNRVARINALTADRQKAQKLETEVSQLAASNQSLAKSTEKLSKAQTALSNEISQKNQAITSLTEQQAKRELELANQRMLLDSLTFRTSMDSMVLAAQKMSIAEKEATISEEKAQKNLSWALAALGLVAALAIGIFLVRARTNNRILAEKNKIIQQERARSEELLLNILPVAVADELKKHGSAEARFYPQVSVLFSDFQNFSQIAEVLPPADLVKELDYCFKAFDAIVGSHGIEKIKTIGDAYMCAGGFQEPETGPRRMVRAALDMQAFLEKWNADRSAAGLPRFEARIGIHSGPIVAGVVGQKKFAYDIWGDTVNIAARMEAAGQPGRVNLSGATRFFVKDDFKTEYRGKLPVKNRGEFDMYFVG